MVFLNSIKKKLPFLMSAVFVLAFSLIHAEIKTEDYPVKHEGVYTFKSYGRVDISYLPQFLPYNPIIIEAGAHEGKDTKRMATQWPKGKVYAFEPIPEAFEILEKKCAEDSHFKNVTPINLALSHHEKKSSFYVCHGTDGTNPKFDNNSSLLKPTKEMADYYKGPVIHVQCVNLDNWCAENNIKKIDILRLETQGMELQILQSSPNIVQTAKIIYLETYFFPYRENMTNYIKLKKYLDKAGFVLLTHWYREGLSGHAIFLSREIYEAYFNLSLGMGI